MSVIFSDAATASINNIAQNWGIQPTVITTAIRARAQTINRNANNIVVQVVPNNPNTKVNFDVTYAAPNQTITRVAPGG